MLPIPVYIKLLNYYRNWERITHQKKILSARGKALRKAFRLPKAEACNNTRLAKFVADEAAKIQGRKNQSARETGQLLGARGLTDGIICRDGDKVWGEVRVFNLMVYWKTNMFHREDRQRHICYLPYQVRLKLKWRESA
jgi:hypothetical protein